MHKNKSYIIIIFLFLAIITLPQIIFWLIKDYKLVEVTTTENRVLNEKPELKLSTITLFPKKFDDYYNDHLAFRTQLRNMWTNLNYNLFNTTEEDKVLVGKDGWLFYREDKSIEDAQGITIYTDEEKNYILNILKENVNKFKEKNIESYVLVLPNKENIYREYLPKSIKIKKDVSRTEELIEYIKDNSDINVIYPKEELLEAKEKYQIYRKYDTHWNTIGSLIGTIALQQKIDPTFSYDVNEMQVEETNIKDERDLADMASLNENIVENTKIVNNFYTDIQYNVVDSGYEYAEYTSNSKNHKTVLFIGDSFRKNIIQHFSKLYDRVIYVHRDLYRKDMIEKLNPDILIIETVERFLNLTLVKNLID